MNHTDNHWIHELASEKSLKLKRVDWTLCSFCLEL
nr:hypothetical protein [Xenorhabdus anantnagensis]